MLIHWKTQTDIDRGTQSTAEIDGGRGGRDEKALRPTGRLNAAASCCGNSGPPCRQPVIITQRVTQAHPQ